MYNFHYRRTWDILFVERNALQRAAVNVVVGIGRGKLGLEHFALHHVLREAVLNALLLVYVRNGRATAGRLRAKSARDRNFSARSKPFSESRYKGIPCLPLR